MKRVWVTVAAVLAVQAGAALLLVWSGLYNVAASEKHLPWTRWILTWALTNSVETHSMTIDVPPLTQKSQFYAGLGHYEGACSPCHGAPDEPRGAVAMRMLPQPPYLPDHVRDWEPAELFWIVKHGFKYTGMPAWPAQSRDDEVWAMVAFLLRLPELTAEEYRRLARVGTVVDPLSIPESAELIASAGPLGESVVACGRCHGMRGLGGGSGAFPRLAGQKPEYLFESLRNYASGARPSGIMQAVASELSEDDMRKLADFYATMSLPPPPMAQPVPADVLARGQAIAERGAPEANVPACGSCHGPDGTAQATAPLFPSLDGQWADYLALQLRLFRDGGRGATATANIMSAAVQRLSDEQIEAVALYYASRNRAPPPS